MTQDRLSGKLAVILHADVAGSTHMVRHDEHTAHERIQDTFHRFSATIQEYSGQVLELRGDALLAEFKRPSDAIAATLAFQSGQAAYLSSLNDDLKPEVRVGIAMGEVVVADNTITGAGVVMAQRVEQLADTGGLCITAAVRESLSGRLSVEFESLGQQELKGFEDPVGVFKVSLAENAVIPLPALNVVSRKVAVSWAHIGALAISALVIVVGLIYWVNMGDSPEETASIERMALPFPDKPSIAVLPFTNMSNDAEQEYFADGMTEDLITDISKISGLFVIARNSVFTYKGQPVNVRQVAEELGVRYVLEGSVRRDGKQIRINAQLIDATTGGHIWGERYDGALDDVFSMQDAITEQIVAALAIELDQGEHDQIARPYTHSIEAYDYFLRGRDHFLRQNKDDNFLGASFFKDAIELDPTFAQAYSLLAWAHTRDLINGWSDSPASSLEQAFEAAQKAIEIDHKLAQAYFVMALVYRSQKDHVKAAREAEKAIEIDPGYADAYVLLASLYYYSGGAEKGLKLIEKAKQLNPNYPSNYPFHLGQAYFLLKQYQKAIIEFQAAIDTNPASERSHVWLAATYGQAGNIDEAEFEAVEVLALDPNFSIQRIRENVPLKVPDDIEHFIGGLQKAGLPD